MSSRKQDYVSSPLEAAVKKAEVDEVRELLEQGADPIYSTNSYKFFSELTQGRRAMNEKDIQIFKLLVQHGAIIERRWFDDLFAISEHSQYAEELVAHVIKYNKDTEFIQMIFSELASSGADEFDEDDEDEDDLEDPPYSGQEDEDDYKFPEPIKLNIFKLLLDHGVPINEFIFDEYEEEKCSTPLHLSICGKKLDFVSLLLQRGADVNKKSLFGAHPLFLATSHSMVELLLDNGANVNDKAEKEYGGATALHRACEYDGREDDDDDDWVDYASVVKKEKIIRLLLQRGADISILNDSQISPLQNAPRGKVFVALQELATLAFENELICHENLEFLKRNEVLYETFENCFKELEKMKKWKFYENYSLYDIFHMRKSPKQLIYLLKNKKLVDKYTSVSGNYKYEFKNYSYDFHYTLFRKTKYRAMTLESEEKKLVSIFKDYLPKLVIHKIAYFVKESSNWKTVIFDNHFEKPLKLTRSSWLYGSYGSSIGSLSDFIEC